MPTLRQSPRQVPDKVMDLLRTQIMKVSNTNHVAEFHDLCPGLCCRLLPTFPVHCNRLNSITATQTGLSWTCHGLCRKHLDMSIWFVSTTFMICVHNFPHGEVSVKDGVMEFGLYPPDSYQSQNAVYCRMWREGQILHSKLMGIAVTVFSNARCPHNHLNSNIKANTE